MSAAASGPWPERYNRCMRQRFVEIEQALRADVLDDLPRAARDAGAALASMLRPGARVAVACGSRGIDGIGTIVSGVVSALLSAGLRPFVVPGMGSHGGATAAGQLEVLAGFGLTEASLGAPIRAGLEVEQVASLPGGVPLYFSRAALDSDAVIPVNRVKLHTTLRAPLGSGLMKMIALGLGHELGARALHAAGLQEHVVPAARELLARVPIHGGVAIVENGEGRVAHLEAVPAAAIPERDLELLALSRSYMPAIPVDPLDVLVVRQMGKNVSGTGMDPNVVGLHRRQGGVPDRHISTLVALDLTEESHGNATGVGMADLITDRLRDKIVWPVTKTNCLTSGFVAGMKLPLSLPSDREAIETAALLHDRQPLRAAIIQDTLHLRRMWISEALLDEAARNPALRVLGHPVELEFQPDGGLALRA